MAEVDNRNMNLRDIRAFPRVASLLIGMLFLGAVGDIPAPQFMLVGTSYNGQILFPSNQLLNPAGKRVTISGRPLDIALSPQSNSLAVRILTEMRLFSTSGTLIRTVPLGTASLIGVAFSPDGSSVISSQLGTSGRTRSPF